MFAYLCRALLPSSYLSARRRWMVACSLERNVHSCRSYSRTRCWSSSCWFRRTSGRPAERQVGKSDGRGASEAGCSPPATPACDPSERAETPQEDRCGRRRAEASRYSDDPGQGNCCIETEGGGRRLEEAQTSDGQVGAAGSSWVSGGCRCPHRCHGSRRCCSPPAAAAVSHRPVG